MARGGSPYRETLYSSPHQRSSPLRRDSPARSPAQHELYKLLDNLNLQEVQHKKVYIHQKNIFQDSLDARQRIRAETDESRIKEAHASRKSVRDDAEATLQAHIKAEAEEKKRRLEEERRRQEEEARQKAEAERRAREEEQRRAREQSEREEATKRAAAERLRQEEEKQRKAVEEEQRRETERQQREAEQARKDAEAEAARKQQEEQQKSQAAAAAAAAATHVPTSQAGSTTAKATTEAIPADIEARHRDYLALHKRLKRFRKDFWEQAKADKAFKSRVGDMRRNVKTHVGQLSIDGPQENKTAMAKVKNAVTQSLQDTFSPQVPINDYLPTHAHVPEPSPTVPSLTIYLLSILSKAVITVSITSYNAKSAEAPGVLVAQVFSIPALQFANPSTTPHPSSLISILLAKFHASAPQLFGITAPETPREQPNMLRLGWRREHTDESGAKTFVPEQTHYDRLIGLGALYAAISLRNFSKTKITNPIPPTQFWESLSLIVNTPGNEMQVGQLVLLKYMLENSVERIIQFWGATGVAMLREAVIGVQNRLGDKVRTHQSAKALGLLKDMWSKEKKFHLV